MSERNQQQREADWQAMLEAALEIPGSVGDTYRRLYQYSMSNIAFFYMQGITPQPVATFNRWKEVGRHVKRGASAYYVLRPITIKSKDEVDETGRPKTFTKFKNVKAIFPIQDTEGDPLPEIELPEWSQQRAIGALGLRQVAFESFDPNTQGYSISQEFAINPAAKYPMKTLLHEIGHITLGHTVPDRLEEYARHRGTFEFEAEATSHLSLNEIGLMTDEMASVSRGYISSWMRGEKPSDRSVRAVFKATDTIVNAGRPESAEAAA